MERTEYSTTMDTDELTNTERQSMVDHCATLAIQMILANPWASIPEMMEYINATGPWPTTGRIVAVFRGRVIFRSMMNRLNIIRLAVLRGEAGSLPITTGVPDGSIPANDQYAHWWAPYFQEGGEMYPANETNMEGAMLQRYPHLGISTEELLLPLGSERSGETDMEHEEKERREEDAGDTSMRDETSGSP